MIIKASDKITYSDGKALPYKQRQRLNGSDFDELVAGGWDIIYVPPVVAPPKTPEELLEEERQLMIVSPAQFRIQLNASGKRQQVEDYFSALPQDDKDRWFHAQEFKRLHPMVITLGTQLGFSETGMDSFFRSAALIEV